MKYIINTDELPETIEAKDLEEAEKIVVEHIDIQEKDKIISEVKE